MSLGISFETLLNANEITSPIVPISCNPDSNPDTIAGVTFCAFKIEMKKKCMSFCTKVSGMNVVVFFFHAPFTADYLLTLQYTFWGQVSNGCYSNSTSNDGIPLFLLVQLFAFNIQSANLTTVVLTFNFLFLFQFG